jgi:hypothetical protein
VFWADNGANFVGQISATGGTAITLAAAPSGYNIGTELAVANGKVAYFLEIPGSRDDPWVATVGLPNSASSTGCGGGGTGGGLSLDSTATHIFFVDTASAPTTYVRDCLFTTQGGPGIVQTLSGTVLMQTVADANYMFYAFPQAGIYRDTIATFSASPAVSGASANSLAVDGTSVYWTQGTIASSTVYRASEANPGAVTTVIPSGVYDYTFATDGVKVYYSDGQHIWSVPAGGGGTAMQLATSNAAGIGQMAVSGKLLVWTDGATIWSLVLP